MTTPKLNAREVRGLVAAALLALLALVLALLPEWQVPAGPALVIAGVLLAAVVQAFGRPR